MWYIKIYIKAGWHFQAVMRTMKVLADAVSDVLQHFFVMNYILSQFTEY